MGALLVDNPTPHSNVQQWLNKVNCKRMRLKQQKQRNLFVEVLLNNTVKSLARLQNEIKSKQQDRLLRWKLMQATLMAQQRDARSDKMEEDCEELRSFDAFMKELNNVKVR